MILLYDTYQKNYPESVGTLLQEMVKKYKIYPVYALSDMKRFINKLNLIMNRLNLKEVKVAKKNHIDILLNNKIAVSIMYYYYE